MNTEYQNNAYGDPMSMDEPPHISIGGYLWKQLGTWFKAIHVTDKLAHRFGGYRKYLKAARSLGHQVKRLGSLPTEYIMRRICHLYDIPEDEFLNSRKRGEINMGRQVYMTLVSEYERFSDAALSEPFGRTRDFAKRLRTQFRDVYMIPPGKMDKANKFMVAVYMQIRQEMEGKLNG